jgi:hypothetical protein
VASLSLARLTAIAAVTLAIPLAAQTTAAPAQTAEQMRAAAEAHKADFDYLLGDWEFTTESQEFGKAHGFWSAARLAEGAQILDEYRVVGDTGETWYVTQTLRVYNAVRDEWDLVSLEPGAGLQNVGTGRKVGQEIHIEKRFGVGTPSPRILRIRYYDIQPDRFSWVADRSKDDGRTWAANALRIEARRIGPPRTLESLAPARK